MRPDAVLRGEAEVDDLLIRLAVNLNGGDELYHLLVTLMSDDDALRGAARRLQKALEAMQ